MTGESHAALPKGHVPSGYRFGMTSGIADDGRWEAEAEAVTLKSRLRQVGLPKRSLHGTEHVIELRQGRHLVRETF